MDDATARRIAENLFADHQAGRTFTPLPADVQALKRMLPGKAR